MRISWAELAIGHLQAAYEYVAADNPRAAERTVERILSAVEFLARHPNLGHPGRVEGTRELVVPDTPFVVAYRQPREEIEILAILHAARKWPERF